jgi:ferredoxin
MVTADPVPVEQEALAEQAIAECPRTALSRKD